MNNASKWICVWDPIIRIGHWLLVAGFFMAYFTEDDFLTQHVWAGYIVTIVIFIRIIWGVIGSTHARFNDFVYPPYQTISYLREMFRKDSPRYLGHNPAGGAMVITLLIGLLITTVSGLMVYAYEENSGPLKNWVSMNETTDSVSPVIFSVAYADSDRKNTASEESEEFWESLHEFFANFTLLLILLHIGGVIFSSIKHRENLIKAMFTGRKSVE